MLKSKVAVGWLEQVFKCAGPGRWFLEVKTISGCSLSVCGLGKYDSAHLNSRIRCQVSQRHERPAGSYRKHMWETSATSPSPGSTQTQWLLWCFHSNASGNWVLSDELNSIVCRINTMECREPCNAFCSQKGLKGYALLVSRLWSRWQLIQLIIHFGIAYREQKHAGGWTWYVQISIWINLKYVRMWILLQKRSLNQ